MYDKNLINSQDVDKTLKIIYKKKTIIVLIKIIFEFKSNEHRNNIKLVHEQLNSIC